ncbi:hypothetical protein [Thermoleptolyngbya sp. M55_K2018_002]|uniref:hypothetical protein n=1 Tax=Thermoleptolyngbya sp. M55_K2018_002 TaxID=2747808 RepID=UPI0025EEFE7A|nr:hypothetical protein [Thermoleptolyngbya sp. M55_K2018_002]
MAGGRVGAKPDERFVRQALWRFRFDMLPHRARFFLVFVFWTGRSPATASQPSRFSPP